MGNKSAKIALYEQVVKTIESQIVSGVYRKGDFLPSEKELTEEHGVSRITIRKALAILSDMGIIETIKGSGSKVLFGIDNREDHKKFSKEVDSYKRLFKESSEIRLMLEPEIAKQVALRATKEQIAHLKACLKGKDAEMSDFHRALVSILDNNALHEVMDDIIKIEEGKAPVGVVLPEHQEKVGKLLDEQHWKIFEAIERGDGEFAYFYMKEHTRYITEMYESYFEHLYY